ncbi:hypothetical protein BLNAU_22715 [Blattamonas nauphoetae]|uniref:Uncharacterized protein n=1 Tax=Blattamonas nauphoetae TaxID=2049346 RepID=A0ABQ9WUG9_9EUKA|nr:hypothetical protein BLNAU_22715 [Blattamonas nauphoetae]
MSSSSDVATCSTSATAIVSHPLQINAVSSFRIILHTFSLDFIRGQLAKCPSSKQNKREVMDFQPKQALSGMPRADVGNSSPGRLNWSSPPPHFSSNTRSEKDEGTHTRDARMHMPRLSIQPSKPILLNRRSIIVECGRADVTQLLGRPFQHHSLSLLCSLFSDDGKRLRDTAGMDELECIVLVARPVMAVDVDATMTFELGVVVGGWMRGDDREDEMFGDAEGAVRVWKRMDADVSDCGICLACVHRPAIAPRSQLGRGVTISIAPRSSCPFTLPLLPLASSSLLVCSVGTAFSLSSMIVDSLIPCSVCLIAAHSLAMLLNAVERWNSALVSSIVEGEQSFDFMHLLAKLLQICPYYQRTMDFVLHMPVILTIPSCLSFFENDHRFEDVSEQQLQHDKGEFHERRIIDHAMMLSNLHGMNLPQR